MKFWAVASVETSRGRDANSFKFHRSLPFPLEASMLRRHRSSTQKTRYGADGKDEGDHGNPKQDGADRGEKDRRHHDADYQHEQG
jgi:hypothetical protein